MVYDKLSNDSGNTNEDTFSQLWNHFQSNDSVIVSGNTISFIEHLYIKQFSLIDIKDNFLFKNRIAHCYERPLSIDDNPEHDLHPDFYLPDLQLYIEHWGMEDNEQYNSEKEYKIPLYQKLKITLICTHENTDSVDIESALRRKLKHYKKGEINFL